MEITGSQLPGSEMHACHALQQSVYVLAFTGSRLPGNEMPAMHCSRLHMSWLLCNKHLLEITGARLPGKEMLAAAAMRCICLGFYVLNTMWRSPDLDSASFHRIFSEFPRSALKSAFKVFVTGFPAVSAEITGNQGPQTKPPDLAVKKFASEIS